VVNERIVRLDLASAASTLPEPAPERLAAAAVARGRTRIRRKQTAQRAATSTFGLAAVVAAFLVAVPGAAPAEAAVECSADRVVVRGAGAVGQHGVRLDVTNTTSQVAVLVAGDVATLVPPGTSVVDVTARPGRLTLTCDTGVSTAFGSLTVADPRGLFVSDQVSCGLTQVRDLRGDGTVEVGDPETLTRSRLGGLPARAVVEPAGYPGATARRVVRVRSGDEVLGVAIWHAMPGPRSWVLDEVHLCAPLVVG